MKEYLAFIRDAARLPHGEEIELVVRDLAPGPGKYDGRRVRAIVSADPQALPGGDLLWIRSLVGVPYPRPWAIRIVKELEGGWKEPPYTDLPTWRR